MSYVHCPTCQRAYHLGREPACPRCGANAKPEVAAAAPIAAPSDPVADIVLAATHLARALARATPAQRDAARASLGLVQDHIATSRAVDPPGLAGLIGRAMASGRPLRALAATAMSRGPVLATAAIAMVARRLFR